MSGKGYGKFYHAGKMLATHRVAWLVWYGSIPSGLWVLHRCDNPPCCNPHHLFLGTHQDNMNDMRSKGRGYHRNTLRGAPPGERHGRAKLTLANVQYIIQQRGQRSMGSLAREFGVSSTTVSRIFSGRNWAVALDAADSELNLPE